MLAHCCCQSLLTEQPISSKHKPDIQGEENYDASRQYKVATKKFIEAGKVERAARDAAPRSDAEAAEMREAEQNREGESTKATCANSEGRASFSLPVPRVRLERGNP